MCLLGVTLQDISRFMWCRQWNPFYTVVMFEAICYDEQSGLSWVASTMFVLVVFAFVVLTVRAGSFELISEEDYLFRYRSRHCLVRCFGFECPHRQATQPPRQDTQPP